MQTYFSRIIPWPISKPAYVVKSLFIEIFSALVTSVNETCYNKYKLLWVRIPDD